MDTRSTGEVVASLIVNTQAMVAKEVELVGLELRRMVARKARAVAMLLVGALAAAGVLMLAAITAALALEEQFAERWMAWGTVTLGSAVVALLLILIAARKLSRGWSPRASREDSTSTGAWLRSLRDELLEQDPTAPDEAARAASDTEAGR